MRVFLGWLAIVLLALSPARSQQQLSQATIYMALQPFLCGGAPNNKGDNYVTFLENYVDGILPNDVYITKVKLWIDGGSAPNATGNFWLVIDPQQQYLQKTGFPAHQAYEPQYLKSIGIMEFAPNKSQQYVEDFNPPVRYSAGDALLVAPECSGPRVLGQFALVNIQSTFDLANLPQPKTLLNVKFDTPTNPSAGVAGQTVRNLVPSSPGPFTKVRCRTSNYEYQYSPNGMGGNYATLQHASVCLQNSVGSSDCAATPVELKFGGASGTTAYNRQWVWSDWTPFSGPAGQNILASASSFSPNVNIVGASWSNGAAVYTVSAPDGLTNGQFVMVMGVAPTEYSTSGNVTVIDSTHFSLPLATNPGPYTSGGSLGNFWSYKASGSSGLWGTTVDSWNTTSLQGAPYFAAGATSMLDMCQVQ